MFSSCQARSASALHGEPKFRSPHPPRLSRSFRCHCREHIVIKTFQATARSLVAYLSSNNAFFPAISARSGDGSCQCWSEGLSGHRLSHRAFANDFDANCWLQAEGSHILSVLRDVGEREPRCYCRIHYCAAAAKETCIAGGSDQVAGSNEAARQPRQGRLEGGSVLRQRRYIGDGSLSDIVHAGCPMMVPSSEAG